MPTASNIVSNGPFPAVDDLKIANISQSATATVVAGVAGKRIFVFAAYMLAGAAATITVNDVSTATTVAQSGALALASGQPLVLPYMQFPYWSCAPGDALVLTQTGSGTVGGNLYYIQ